MNEKGSLYAGIPAHLPEELCEILVASGQVRIERIVTPPIHGARPAGLPAAGAIPPSCGIVTPPIHGARPAGLPAAGAIPPSCDIVSRGHTSPEGFWYDQAQDEFVLLVKGRAGLRFEGDDRVLVLEAGEYLNIPARVRHRVEWTDPDGDTVWLAVHHATDGAPRRRG